jgi:ubiquinone/menaquinone biosynthesis C-methylase UbiE
LYFWGLGILETYDLSKVENIIFESIIDEMGNSINCFEWRARRESLPGKVSIINWYAAIADEIEFKKNQIFTDNDSNKYINLSLYPKTDYIGMEYKDYVLAPAKMPIKFDLMIIRGEDKKQCLKYAKSLILPNGLIYLRAENIREEEISKYLEYYAALKIKSDDLSNTNLYIFSKNSKRLHSIAKRINTFNIKGVNIIEYYEVEEACEQSSQPAKAQSDKIDSLSCLFIHKYDQRYLTDIYSNYELSDLNYSEQKNYILNKALHKSDYFSYNLSHLGWETDDMIGNCAELQSAWVREYSDDVTIGKDVLIEQIKRSNPAVVYFTDVSLLTPDLAKEIKKYCKLLVAFSSEYSDTNSSVYAFDLIFSNNLKSIEKYRSLGIASIYQSLGYDERLCAASDKGLENRKYECIYIGSCEKPEEIEFLKAVSEKTNIFIWSEFEINNEIKRWENYKGKISGSRKYELLAQSKIILINECFNQNGDFHTSAYEAAAKRTLNIVDYRDGLGARFEIGEECVAYRSVEEAVALIKYYGANLSEAEVISGNAKSRAASQYSYASIMADCAEYLSRFLLHRTLRNSLTPNYDESEGELISEIHESEQAATSLINTWKSPNLPIKQRAIVQDELKQLYKSSTPPLLFDILKIELKPIVRSGDKIIDIGCASAYYSEAIEYLLSKKIQYHGVDYSEEMIKMAEMFYPKHKFKVADASALPYSDDEFKIAICSGLISYNFEYSKIIAEAARVSSRFVIFHRTPISKRNPTKLYKKRLYSEDFLEIRFNEAEFLDRCLQNNLRLIDSVEYYKDEASDVYESIYLFKKSK